MSLTLIVVNPLSGERIAALEAAVPGLTVKSFKSPKYALASGALAEADAIAMWGFHDAEPLLAAASRVRWVHSLSDGVEKLLTPSMLARPIALTNSRGVHDRSVSEHTLALLLSWYHCIPETVRNQDSHVWKRPHADILEGKTVFIAGFGRIGHAIAEKLRPFGVRITASRRSPAPDPLADRIYAPDEKEKALAEADIVIAALPATPETELYFDAAAFAAMKKSALFINIARASVVDETALIDALTEGRLASAALDVFSSEPLATESPLWDMRQVILTPHTASLVPDFWDRLLALLARNAKAFSEGAPLENLIDKEKGY